MDLGDHVWALRDGLLSLLRENQLTDITLKVGGREFRAHRIVLVAGSNYFRASLTRGFKEGAQDVLEFPDLDPDVFQLVLELIYGEGSLDPGSIKAEFEFIRQCHYFEVTGITDGALLHRNKIPLENFTDYLTLLTEIYPERNIPEWYQVNVRGMIHEGADLSVLSDETLIDLLPAINYSPVNLLDFHSRIQKLVDDGHSPELFSLINYRLLPEAYRPDGRETEGPIPSLEPNEHEKVNVYQRCLVVSEPFETERYHISSFWTMPYLSLTKVVVLDKEGDRSEILIDKPSVKIGDVLIVRSASRTNGDYFSVQARGDTSYSLYANR